MIYKLIDNTWTPANLRQDFPNTSFPSDLTNATLPDGYAYCHPSSAPVCGRYEQAIQTEPIMVDGKLTQQWKKTTGPMIAIVASKIAEIRSERKRIEVFPVVLNETPFDMDATARTKYVETMLTFTAFPELEIPGWKASDNAETGLGYYVTMTKSLLNAVWALGLEQAQKAFAWEAAKQAEIDAAISAEDIEALISVETTYNSKEE